MKSIKEIVEGLISGIPRELRNQIVLVGSVNLFIQGVAIIPKKDIDFATNYQTVQKLNKFFGNKVKKFCQLKNGDDYLPFSYLFINIDGYEVEFFDAVNYGKSYYLGHIIDANLKKLIGFNSAINGLRLNHELLVYGKSNKRKKTKALKKFLGK